MDPPSELPAIGAGYTVLHIKEEKGMTEDEMVRWHHRLDGHGTPSPGVGDGQGGLACCGSWSRTIESDTIEQLN